jgi:beta-galactosidase
VLSTCNRPKAAFVFDWENYWAIEYAAAILRISYPERIAAYFQGLCEAGIDVDIVDMDDTLEGYELVIAPLNYMYRGDYIENVKRFVARGGTYVTTYWSGEVNDSDLCFLEEHPLREVLGIRTEEIDVRPLDTPNHVLYKDGSYEIKDLCALVHAETADVLATYESDFYQGYPAITRNSYGKGQAYFIAAEAEYGLVKALYEDVLREKNLTCELSENIPDNVFITRRSSADESTVLWFVMNFNPTQVTINVESNCADIENAQEVSGEIVLEGYACKILKEQNAAMH